MNAQTMRRGRNGRDSVSNRTRLLPRGVDMRTVAGRRFRHLVQQYSAELGQDLGEVDQGMVRQAAAISVHAERLQAAIVAGQDVDADQVIRLSSECRRILASLRSKAPNGNPTGPSLAQYLAERAARATGEPETTEST